MKLFLGLLALLPLKALAQTSYVPSAQLLKEKGYQLNLGGDYFITSHTVDEDAKKQKLDNSQKFNRIQAEFGGLYGLKDNFQIGIGGRFRSHVSETLVGEDKVNSTSSGLQSIFTSVTFGFKPEGKWLTSAEGLFRYVPYSNEVVTSTDFKEKLVLGDEGNEYSLGLATTYAFNGNNYLSARAGWRNPGTDLSSEIYWQAEGALVWKHLALLAGVDGVTSLGNSTYDDDPTSRPTFNTGASALYNSINRQWVTPYVGANIALNQNWRVELKASQVVQGRSTDLGTAFGINIVNRTEKKATKTVDTRFKAYDLEATVTKVSPKKSYLVIDKGVSDDVEKGQRFDFFEFDYVGGNILVARGVVIQVKSETAVVKITHQFNMKKEIRAGLVGRASLR